MSSLLTLEEFSTNFVVKVVDYDDKGNSIVKVVFEVRCLVNNRIGVFIAEIDTTNLSINFTQQDVIERAWMEVKDSVNEWGAVMLSKPVYVQYTVETVSENSQVNLEDFNSNFIVSIRRFELYPSSIPYCWCVGFYIYQLNQPSTNMYIDESVPIEDHCNNVLCKTIAGAVWDKVKEKVCCWASSQLNKQSLIDATFYPTFI